MKIDRLISILIVLLRKQRVQAKELADMFDVSVRTILRDVDTINLAGIPIVTYQGTNGGIGIVEGFKLDKSLLTSDDMAAIITALRSVAYTMPDSRHKILMEKFKNTLSASQLELLNSKTSQLIIDLTPWGGNEQLKDKLDLIRKSIENYKQLEFKYVDSEGNRTERIVEPYSLVLKGQSWYLYAWCLIRQGYRLFKISRLSDVKVKEICFEPRDVSLEELPWDNEWTKPEKMVEIELLFDSELSSTAVEWFGDNAVEGDDGKIKVKTMLTENNWLYSFILGFGPGVEVINPPHIRAVIKDMAERIYKKHLPEQDI